MIESIVEDIDAKKDLFRELNHICADDAILATNTSTLPVIDLAMETHKPERVCGVHFFNPAPMMSLVEIVRPITATDDTIAEVRALRRGVRQEPGRGQGSGRLHRQRAALPVPQQRSADARERHRHAATTSTRP